MDTATHIRIPKKLGDVMREIAKRNKRSLAKETELAVERHIASQPK